MPEKNHNDHYIIQCMAFHSRVINSVNVSILTNRNYKPLAIWDTKSNLDKWGSSSDVLQFDYEFFPIGF